MTTDTIAALATARGIAALAVIRISGPAAIPILERHFRAAGRRPPFPARSAMLGELVCGEERIDQVVALFFPGPHSYTGEDLVELMTHGGEIVPERVLELLHASGARPARAGEFTQRAYLNGKLDLTQAEAVESLITARSAIEAQAALRVLGGGLREVLAASIDALVEAQALLEASLDIQEDGAPDTLSPIWDPARESMGPRVGRLLARERARLRRLLEGARARRMLRAGYRIVFAGRSNAGKSSLFNAFLGRERAIVSPEPGTTRDFLDEPLDWEDLRIVLTDTAGAQRAKGAIAEASNRRTREALAAASLVVEVVDVAATSTEELAEDLAALNRPAGEVIVALHKWDLGAGRAWQAWLAEREGQARAAGPAGPAAGKPRAPTAVPSSVKASPDVAPLRAAIEARMRVLGSEAQATLIVAERQAERITRAVEALERAEGLLREGAGAELIAFETRGALDALGELLGRRVGHEVLEQIFSRFCVGK
ncbi:MAG: tRNA uridine-5-carboxymethylaminomethyl(34) synthesis GTPase MnmE [Candidatus Eisenbacteria sp.]|nr:tRNA uridine-5-carboxymethylaminomethyl(34) synthesis GTPase MnmE [Candidatus Eisenbacteria bacterium]